MNEQRLIDLEVKISHQEIAIEALQQALYEQQKDIARLQDRLNRHTKRLEEMAEGSDHGPDRANEKPPHY